MRLIRALACSTAPGGNGANYGAPTWPPNLTQTGLGLGMQACIGGDRQAWNYSSADQMLVLPKDGSCLGAPSLVNSSGSHHPVVWQKAGDGNCDTSSPHPHQQWVLKPAAHGQLVASSADGSLCIAEGPRTEQVLSGPASDGSRREMSAAEPWGWCVNNSNMYRTNTDINPSWGSIMTQLESRVGLGRISRPGSWAFPDGAHLSPTQIRKAISTS